MTHDRELVVENERKIQGTRVDAPGDRAENDEGQQAQAQVYQPLRGGANRRWGHALLGSGLLAVLCTIGHARFVRETRIPESFVRGKRQYAKRSVRSRSRFVHIAQTPRRHFPSAQLNTELAR